MILAVKDDSVKDDIGDDARQRQATILELRDGPRTKGDAWRCASCYRDRFKTMNFGQQQLGDDHRCLFCGKSVQEAQWSMWIPYENLPRDVQMRVDRMFAPKLLNVLRTRWIDAEIEVLDKNGNVSDSKMKLPST